MTTLDGFVAKTNKMAGELQRLEKNTVKIAALAYKTSVLSQLQVAGVKNGKLRGVGKKGAKVGVKFTVTGTNAIVKATGPLHLLERDTKAHRLGRATRSTSGRSLVDSSGQDIKSVLVIPGVGFRAFADHPGTKGKYPWKKGIAAGQPIAEKAHQVALGQALRKAFR